VSGAAVLLDVDGTLVDSVYQHAIAWHRAFLEFGRPVPAAVLHRHIGMGGDQLVSAVAGDAVERESGDRLRDLHQRAFAPMLDEVVPLPGARELLEGLRAHGLRIVLASSAQTAEVEHYLDLLGARHLVHAWTTDADVRATKPAPDAIEAALEAAGTRRAVMVGDAVWDHEAAARAGVPSVGLLSGGVAAEELRRAGARSVHEDPRDLLAALPDAVLASPSAPPGPAVPAGG
jgi:HAD superfamily hydrolase (TIGR01509 family)